MEICVWSSNVCVDFSFYAYYLFISGDDNFCLLAFSPANSENEFVAGIEKLESIQVNTLPAVYLDLPYFPVILRHHVYLHTGMTLLHSAHSVAQNKIEFRFPTVVLKTRKHHVFSRAWVAVLNGLAWKLKLFVMVPLLVAHFLWQPYNWPTPHDPNPLGHKRFVETFVQ